MTDFLVSRATRDKLQEELKTLKTVRRPQVAEALAEARAHGDLKENAEYDAAKQEQGLLEARIREVEDNWPEPAYWKTKISPASMFPSGVW